MRRLSPIHEAFLEVAVDYALGELDDDFVIGHLVRKVGCTKEEAKKFLKDYNRGDR